jgi:protein involved in polysaccharide export with SLBB domain
MWRAGLQIALSRGYIGSFTKPGAKFMKPIVVLVLAGLLLAAPAVSVGQSSAEQSTTLRAGDVLRVTVWRNQELSGEFVIASDGSIAHPLYRELRVAGMTPAAVEERMHEFLVRFEASPRFVVEPLFRVSVGGEVRQPNLYSLPVHTTIAEAVALAGGVTERGRLDRVRLIRGNEEIWVDLTQPDHGLAQSAVRSGDQLFVARRVNIWREYITPAGSIASAIISLANLLIRTL